MKTRITRNPQAPLAAVMLGLALAATARAGQSSLPNPQGYTYTKVASLGDPAPGPEGGTFVNDFEPHGINDRGEISFVADVSTGGEGFFMARAGQIQQILRSGEPVWGGGTIDGGFFGDRSLNSEGDATVQPFLNPFTFPVGANTGAYRYSHNSGSVSPIVVPYVTAAPGGGTFTGTDTYTHINNAGTVVFNGQFTGGDIDPSTPPGFAGLGEGIFLADAQGVLSAIVRPGDPAPGGSVFDWAECPFINDAGDIAFEAHIAGELCTSLTPGQDPVSQQPFRIACSSSIFFKPVDGPIQSIARVGQPAPGGGTYWDLITPIVNNQREIAFTAVLSPPGPLNDLNPDSAGIFLYGAGQTISVARPGDAMPGGGKLLRASALQLQVYLNDRGDVVFDAALDSDVNGDGISDTGLWVWSAGKLHLVARTGTVIPGVGTVAHIMNPFGVSLAPTTASSNVAINNHGQVLFSAILQDGNDVLLVATPKP